MEQQQQQQQLTDHNGVPIGALRMHQDNVLVCFRHHEKRDEVTPGGIVVPEQARSPDMIDGVLATVVAVGPGWYPGWRCADCGRPTTRERGHFEPAPFAVGDQVVVESSYTGDVVHVDGVEHRIIRVANVIGVVEED